MIIELKMYQEVQDNLKLETKRLIISVKEDHLK